MADTDQVATYLAEVRERAAGEIRSVAYIPGDVRWSCNDIPRLLAAVEAVLKQHQPGRVVILGACCSRHEAHRHFSITSTEAADVSACPECSATVYVSCTGCGVDIPLNSCPARTAISRALLGEGGSSARSDD